MKSSHLSKLINYCENFPIKSTLYVGRFIISNLRRMSKELEETARELSPEYENKFDKIFKQIENLYSSRPDLLAEFITNVISEIKFDTLQDYTFIKNYLDWVYWKLVQIRGIMEQTVAESIRKSNAVVQN